MNKMLYVSLFGVIFLIALVFSLQNLDPVKIYFYRGAGKEMAVQMPLALVLTLELLAGVIIGYGVQMIRYLKLKTENARLRKQIQAASVDPALDR
ncbi:MAG: lipopolysaccharide assembly protein LapA domain-containing protein [Gammaproteobacteria bacterium]